jgi:hypothetical protein
LSNSNVHVASNSSIAAVQWKDYSGIQIRLYCQGKYAEPHSPQHDLTEAESTSDAVQEYCSGNPWTRGATLPTACPGSSIAAAKWMQDGIHLRIYYQDPGLALKEHCWDGGWYEGK